MKDGRISVCRRGTLPVVFVAGADDGGLEFLGFLTARALFRTTTAAVARGEAPCDNVAAMWRNDLREGVVVDCSRVRTPQELCQRLRELLRVTVVPDEDTVGALAQALRRVRAVHITPWFELHGVEALEANGHAEFVSAIELLGRALDEEGAEARLSVIREGQPPRGRLFQHHAFRSSDLQGCVVEAARCWRGSKARANGCSILWLKPAGRHWQRFFLDAGAAFWEEWDDEMNLSEFEELADELHEFDSLRGLVLGEVEAAGFGEASSALHIGLGGDGALWLMPADPRVLDSDALLLVALPTGLPDPRCHTPG